MRCVADIMINCTENIRYCCECACNEIHKGSMQVHKGNTEDLHLTLKPHTQEILTIICTGFSHMLTPISVVNPEQGSKCVHDTSSPTQSCQEDMPSCRHCYVVVFQSTAQASE